MNNQQDEVELKVNQNIINEYQPNHFKIDN